MAQVRTKITVTGFNDAEIAERLQDFLTEFKERSWLRYMTSQSMARKFPARKYIEWTREFPALAIESATLDMQSDTASGELEQRI